MKVSGQEAQRGQGMEHRACIRRHSVMLSSLSFGKWIAEFAFFSAEERECPRISIHRKLFMLEDLYISFLYHSSRDGSSMSAWPGLSGSSLSLWSEQIPT